MDELKMILESGENLSQLLASGGAYLFVYLGMKLLLTVIIFFGFFFVVYKIATLIAGTNKSNRQVLEIARLVDVKTTCYLSESQYSIVLARIKKALEDSPMDA